MTYLTYITYRKKYHQSNITLLRHHIRSGKVADITEITQLINHIISIRRTFAAEIAKVKRDKIARKQCDLWTAVHKEIIDLEAIRQRDRITPERQYHDLGHEWEYHVIQFDEDF